MRYNQRTFNIDTTSTRGEQMQATATLLKDPTISAEDFRLAMRRLAGGVSIISGVGPDGPLGVTATAVMSLTAEPPSVVCCLNRSLELETAVKETGRFAVNMLRVDHHDLAMRFAGMHGVRGSAKFEQGNWTILPSDVPALSDSLVTFDCRVDGIVEVGTHSIFVGLITEAHFGESGDPLVYCDGTFASLAPL
jgi:flavin reductase (DIM6/NTAB) family NADH-FMN oxidoreductase RutF